VRHGRHVPDHGDFQANGLQRPDGRLAARPRALHPHFHFLHAVRHGLARGVLGHLLGRVCGALARALEPDAPGAGPPERVPMHVGDGHQRIYNAIPIPLSRAGIDVRGRSRRLKINYRTSEQIRRWAHGLLSGVSVDDLDGGSADTTGDRSVFRGPDPQVRTSDDLETLASYAVTWVQHLINDLKLGSHEICVTPNAGFVRTALESAGIKTLELKPRQADPGQSEPGVRFGSMQRIKGLEFRAVVMVLDDKPIENGDVRQRFERYVAATRAREQLMVLVQNVGEK